MEWLKSVWAKWKVQVSFVGGALVVATAYGTCTFDPPAVDDESADVSEEVPEAEVTETSADSTSTTATTQEAVNTTENSENSEDNSTETAATTETTSTENTTEN